MENELSITELIQKLKNHELSGKSLLDEDRQHVVGCLRDRGESCASIGLLLGYSDRQIRRIYQEFRKANAHHFSQDFWREEIGSFVRTTESAKEFLVRTYHDSTHDISNRVPAAAALWRLSNETMTTLGRLGCLPTQDLVIKDRLYLESVTTPKKIEETEELPKTEDDRLIEKVLKLILTPMDREKLSEFLRVRYMEQDPAKQKEVAKLMREKLEDLVAEAAANLKRKTQLDNDGDVWMYVI